MAVEIVQFPMRDAGTGAVELHQPPPHTVELDYDPAEATGAVEGPKLYTVTDPRFVKESKVIAPPKVEKPAAQSSAVGK